MRDRFDFYFFNHCISFVNCKRKINFSFILFSFEQTGLGAFVHVRSDRPLMTRSVVSLAYTINS
jgi:hypothetical protein